MERAEGFSRSEKLGDCSVGEYPVSLAVSLFSDFPPAFEANGNHLKKTFNEDSKVSFKP
jgi:hypothetical protein